MTLSKSDVLVRPECEVCGVRLKGATGSCRTFDDVCERPDWRCSLPDNCEGGLDL